MNIVRVVLAIAALGVIFVTPFWVETPAGSELVVSGLIVDLIAVAIIVWAAWSWWRQRRRA
jgi:hypothetical protein